MGCGERAQHSEGRSDLGAMLEQRPQGVGGGLLAAPHHARDQPRQVHQDTDPGTRTGSGVGRVTHPASTSR